MKAGLVAVVLLGQMAVSTTFAAEVECPRIHPQFPDKRFVTGGPLLGDAPIGSTPDTSVRRGDRHLDTIDYSELDIRTGGLMCEYDGGAELVIRVPGTLKLCHWLERDVLRPKPVEPNTGGPVTSITLRFWCTYQP